MGKSYRLVSFNLHLNLSTRELSGFQPLRNAAAQAGIRSREPKLSKPTRNCRTKTAGFRINVIIDFAHTANGRPSLESLARHPGAIQHFSFQNLTEPIY